jgi:hypothetical protein
MFRIEKAALIADLAAEAGVLATDDALALGEADPVAAAAAIQAQLDVAALAQATELEPGQRAFATAPGEDVGPAGTTDDAAGSSPALPGDDTLVAEGTSSSVAPAQAKPRRRIRG